MLRWAPQILALLCGAFVYWKLLGSCDFLLSQTWNRVPFVKDKKCADIKYMKWALVLVGLCCACFLFRLTTRAREFLTPSEYY